MQDKDDMNFQDKVNLLIKLNEKIINDEEYINLNQYDKYFYKISGDGDTALLKLWLLEKKYIKNYKDQVKQFLTSINKNMAFLIMQEALNSDNAFNIKKKKKKI